LVGVHEKPNQADSYKGSLVRGTRDQTGPGREIKCGKRVKWEGFGPKRKRTREVDNRTKSRGLWCGEKSGGPAGAAESDQLGSENRRDRWHKLVHDCRRIQGSHLAEIDMSGERMEDQKHRRRQRKSRSGTQSCRREKNPLSPSLSPLRRARSTGILGCEQSLT